MEIGIIGTLVIQFLEKGLTYWSVDHYSHTTLLHFPICMTLSQNYIGYEAPIKTLPAYFTATTLLPSDQRLNANMHTHNARCTN